MCEPIAFGWLVFVPILAEIAAIIVIIGIAIRWAACRLNRGRRSKPKSLAIQMATNLRAPSAQPNSVAGFSLMTDPYVGLPLNCALHHKIIQ
jgi:hypothetical protein